MPYVRIQLFRGWNSACDIEVGTKNEGVLDWTMPTLLDLQQTKQTKKTKRRNGVVEGREGGEGLEGEGPEEDEDELENKEQKEQTKGMFGTHTGTAYSDGTNVVAQTWLYKRGCC